jgi:hypothetical protein
MNDDHVPPVLPPASAAPAPSRTRRGVATGFAIEAAILIIAWISTVYRPLQLFIGLSTMMGVIFLPVVALVLLSFKRTRHFGLGVLLAAGVGLLILGAICAGAYR